MDFIERLFGVSPDGGDGSLESMYLIAVAAAAVMTGVLLWRRARAARR